MQIAGSLSLPKDDLLFENYRIFCSCYQSKLPQIYHSYQKVMMETPSCQSFPGGA